MNLKGNSFFVAAAMMAAFMLATFAGEAFAGAVCTDGGCANRVAGPITCTPAGGCTVVPGSGATACGCAHSTLNKNCYCSGS